MVLRNQNIYLSWASKILRTHWLFISNNNKQFPFTYKVIINIIIFIVNCIKIILFVSIKLFTISYLNEELFINVCRHFLRFILLC